MEIVFLIVGIIIGVVIGYFVAASKKSGSEGRIVLLEESTKRAEGENAQLKTQLENERSAYNRQIRELEAEKGRFYESARRVPQLEEELNGLRDTVKNLNAEYKGLTERYSSEKESMEVRLQELKDAKEALTKEFEVIANKIFETKQKTFTDQTSQNLESLLKPFKENIDQFKTRVESIYTEETRDRSSLKTELQALRELNKQLSEGAQNLTEALKGDNKTLGDWGEVVLERLFETSGLEKGREYETQFSTRDSDGSTYRPDAIIHLPGGKQIIVDAKASLKAYEQYHATDDTALKETFLKEHVRSVRSHIKLLSDKDYSRLEGINSLDYVLMFIPIEPAFNLLIKEAKEIYTEAFEKNIVIVTHTTLFATLKTIQNIWKTEKRNENAILIAKKVQDFLKKLEGFVANFEEVGRAIDKAQRMFHDANGQLKNGRGNLASRGHEIARLGGFEVKRLTAGETSDEDEAEDFPERISD